MHLHVSITRCSSSAETNCINTASGNSRSMLVAEMFAGWKKTLHVLLYQIAALFLYNFVLMFLYLYICVACFALQSLHFVDRALCNDSW
jgi:hypothetical protein